jgi:uncharacterized protein YkwD
MSFTDRPFPFCAGSWSQRCARFTVALLAGFTVGVGHSGPAVVSGTAAQRVFVADRASDGVPLNASTACGLPDFRAALEQRLNAARAVARSCGNSVMPVAGPLVWNQRLFSAADRHARDMATRNYFSHTSLDGRSLAQRVAAEGYAWTSVGENLAAGQSTVDGVLSGWLSSPGHCSNLMSRQFEAVGVSCVWQAGSRFGHYWVMVLARP